jgi:hypothetical protein
MILLCPILPLSAALAISADDTQVAQPLHTSRQIPCNLTIPPDSPPKNICDPLESSPLYSAAAATLVPDKIVYTPYPSYLFLPIPHFACLTLILKLEFKSVIIIGQPLKSVDKGATKNPRL